MNAYVNGGIGNSEAFEKFQKTAELVARNKLNKSNAFDNRLTDEIEVIFNEIMQSVDHNWTHFSLFIEACGKIYGYCVDYLHDETYKILGGVNRAVENEQNIQDKPPSSQKKCLLHGQNTLETHESLLNIKDLDTLNAENPSFAFYRGSIDSSEFSGLILNKVAVNAGLNSVINEDDLVLGEVTVPQAAEVNLEGIIEFSVCQLLDAEIINQLTKFEQITNPSQPSSQSEFIKQWESINENPLNSLSTNSISDEDYKEDESNLEEEEVPFKSHLSIEERILEDYSLDFIQSSNRVIFSKESLAAGVTKKQKKRKRKEAFKEEIINGPLCMMKIEELPDEGKFLTVEERKKTAEGGKVERGFRESRFCELFTRGGKNVKVVGGENFFQDFDTPLCVDPTVKLSPVSREARSEGRLDLNIRALKESMKKVIKDNSRGDFSSIYWAVEEDLKKNSVESVSIPTCFVTLLHLANEHSLNLELLNDSNFLVNSSYPP